MIVRCICDGEQRSCSRLPRKFQNSPSIVKFVYKDGPPRDVWLKSPLSLSPGHSHTLTLSLYSEPPPTVKMQLPVVLVSLFALAVSAVPAAIEKRSTTCGSTTYSTAQVNAASNAACSHVKAGTVAGSSTYPHRYNNYEGFDFDVSGPWYEFPIKTSGVYTGGESCLFMCLVVLRGSLAWAVLPRKASSV